ncbi:MAG: adenylosuccinate lyase [Pirellulaceae bacterium]|nr:MAG: adenylosuccinate lyase [Pirellulaceae bacterium]
MTTGDARIREQTMTIENDTVYHNPLVRRYASAEMSELWSERRRVRTWRQLWLALAETQKELGLPITDEQLDQMRVALDDIDWAAAQQYEQKLRHDVMAHLHAFADRCPAARGIIHWGATSCFVTDNADLILMRDALGLVRDRLVSAIDALAEFARRFRDLPCLAFTHFQPAQPTTVGKRACLWLYDLVTDLEEIETRLARLKARGVKGTTGTQASFLHLFAGDHQKVRQLDHRLAQKIGFASAYPVTGQTYPRKVDTQILDALAGIGQSAHKMATDVRLLAHRRELDEPFEAEQVGSSAMAYKRNPMRSERICALARYLMGLPAMAAQTAAVQWLERTLDDSALRRVVIPQAFLAADAVLVLYGNVVSGLVVYPAIVKANLDQELPFLATEIILMEAVRRGGDRQELHERLRRHSLQAARKIKEEGAPNDLLERLKADPAFAQLPFDSLCDPKRFVGRAVEQVDEFLNEVVHPLLARYPDRRRPAEVRV